MTTGKNTYITAMTTAGLIALLLSGTAFAMPETKIPQSNAISTPIIVELAGADDSDPASKKQLRDAGVEMIPDASLKKSPANLQPIQLEAQPKKAEPVAPPVAPIEPQPVIPKKAAVQPEPTVEPASPPQTVMKQDPSGPYLRADVGYSLVMDTDGSQSAGALSSGSVDDTAVLGGGIGYRFNQNFRTDIALDYRFDSGVTATTAAGNTARTEVDGTSIMINGYWDIAKFDAFTPYVGAGVGYAHLSTATQTTTGGVANEDGDSTDNLAWAVTVGSSVDITSSLAVDVNYRFSDLGEFRQATSTTYDDFQVHEARAGLRYSF